MPVEVRDSMRVYIDEEALPTKPKRCEYCPMCNDYDDCVLQTQVSDTWVEQYARCPLREE